MLPGSDDSKGRLQKEGTEQETGRPQWMPSFLIISGLYLSRKSILW